MQRAELSTSSVFPVCSMDFSVCSVFSSVQSNAQCFQFLVFNFQCFQFSVFSFQCAVFRVQCSQSRAVRRADGGSCWSYPAKRRGVCALFGRSGGYDGGCGGGSGGLSPNIFPCDYSPCITTLLWIPSTIHYNNSINCNQCWSIWCYTKFCQILSNSTRVQPNIASVLTKLQQ